MQGRTNTSKGRFKLCVALGVVRGEVILPVIEET